MTAPDWERRPQLNRGEINVEIVFSMMASRACKMKLLYPNTEAIKGMVAIVAAIHEAEPNEALLYQWYHKTKKKIVTYRTRPGRPSAGPRTYPSDPAEFMASYPECYKHEEPVPSKIDDMQLFNAKSRTSARSTHSSVRDNARLTSRTTLVDLRTSNHAQSPWSLSLPNDAAIKQMAAAFSNLIPNSTG